MPQNPTDRILASLRAIVDAGGPQTPVVSGARPSSTIKANTGLDRLSALPSSDEPLAQSNPIDAIFGHGALESVGDLGNAEAGPANAVSMFANKALREVATQRFRRRLENLGPGIQQAGEEFASKYPRIAAHADPMKESGYYRYPANTPAAAVIPYGKIEQPVPIEFADNRSGREVAANIKDARETMFHEGTHVAQGLGNSDFGELYDEAERLFGYHGNPFELPAYYAGIKARGDGPPELFDRPDNAIRVLQGYAEDLGPDSALAKLLAKRRR